MSFLLGLVRNSPEMTEEFRRQDGVTYLLGALQSGVDKLVLKSAFLLSSILTELPHKGMRSTTEYSSIHKSRVTTVKIL